jgi:hypothetical protein
LTVRATVLMAGGLALAAVLVIAAGVSLAPLSRSCAPGLSEAACEGSVSAVLRRGLPGFHPLILGAHAEAGPAAGSSEVGHRATLTFDLLAVPGPTIVELHYDQGGHWGGRSDRSAAEIAAWTLLPLALASVVGVGLVAWRRRRQRHSADTSSRRIGVGT